MAYGWPGAFSVDRQVRQSNFTVIAGQSPSPGTGEESRALIPGA